MASSKKDRDGLFRRGQIYYCWIRGERISTRCRSRAAAKAVRDQLERARVDPVYRASHGATVGELCRVTLEEVARRGRSKSTVEYYTSKLGQVVRGLGSDTVLAELNADLIDRYIDVRRAEKATQHTISKELGAMRHMLRVAKRREAYAGEIEALFPIGFASGYEPRRRALTWEEIPKLLGELEPHRRAWVALAIATGGRESEVARVEARDVSAALDVVQLRGTKTDLSDDAVAIPQAYQWLLKLALQFGAAEGPLVGIWPNSVRDLAAAAKRAEMARVGPNDLRRTHSTLLRAAGVPLDLVARQLRHADTRMVERVYGRLTAQQVGKLLPAHTPGGSADAASGDGAEATVDRLTSSAQPPGELTDQHRPTAENSAPAENTDPQETCGVSDGDRTRDTWSHKPETHDPRLPFEGPDYIPWSEEFASTEPASTTNSTDFGIIPAAPETDEVSQTGRGGGPEKHLLPAEAPGEPARLTGRDKSGGAAAMPISGPGTSRVMPCGETARLDGSSREDVTAGRDPRSHSPSTWAIGYAARDCGVMR